MILPADGVSQEESSEGVPGSQAIRRAFQLLRAVAGHAEHGVRLADLAEEAGLAIPTTHRILQALAHEGMVEQDAGRRYRLGNGFILVAETSKRTSLQERLHPVLERMAAALGCSVFLSVRVGLDMLCIDRVTGQQPIRVVPYDIGERRPLGVGAASIALLAQEPSLRAKTIMERNAGGYARYGLTTGDVERMVSACRKRGYSYNPGHFIPGVAGLGIAVRDPHTQTLAAVNVTTLAPQLARQARRDEIAAHLSREINGVLDLGP